MGAGTVGRDCRYLGRDLRAVEGRGEGREEAAGEQPSEVSSLALAGPMLRGDLFWEFGFGYSCTDEYLEYEGNR